MKKVTEKQYKEAEAKIEKLLPLVDDNTPIDEPNLIELKRVSDIVESYELEHYPIETTALNEAEILIALSKTPGTDDILSKF
jgi:HTH-type transcriptional regulator / antitoxin HigA